MKRSKVRAYARAVLSFIAGASFVSGLWMINLYNQIADSSIIPYAQDEKTKKVSTPSLAKMAEKRSKFTHEDIHPHSSEKDQKIILKILEAISVETDAGTLELIDTAGEHYNKTSLMVAWDIYKIANGDYKIASHYDVKMERRLDGDTVTNAKGKIALKNIKYIITQTWSDDPSGVWKIGQRILNFGDPTPKSRILPDDRNIAINSFIDVLPQVMKASIPEERSNDRSSELHRIR